MSYHNYMVTIQKGVVQCIEVKFKRNKNKINITYELDRQSLLTKYIKYSIQFTEC